MQRVDVAAAAAVQMLTQSVATSELAIVRSEKRDCRWRCNARNCKSIPTATRNLASAPVLVGYDQCHVEVVAANFFADSLALTQQTARPGLYMDFMAAANQLDRNNAYCQSDWPKFAFRHIPRRRARMCAVQCRLAYLESAHAEW
jgi:hypothetical protein